MKFKRIFFLLLLFLCVANQFSAQVKPKTTAPVAISNAVKSSPAFAEILLRKTELESTLEDLSLEYTDEYPKVKETRFELAEINKWMEKIIAVQPGEVGKLTQALGKLILRKVELDTDLHFLQQKFGDEHPNVKRAKRKVAVFEKAVKEILP